MSSLKSGIVTRKGLILDLGLPAPGAGAEVEVEVPVAAKLILTTS